MREAPKSPCVVAQPSAPPLDEMQPLVVDSSADVQSPVDEDQSQDTLSPVPKAYVEAAKGDMAVASARWKATLAWRKKERVDSILDEPMPHFGLIKANFPHYFHKCGRKHEPVFYEKYGHIEWKRLRAHGVPQHRLLRHSTLCIEFLWRVLMVDDDQPFLHVVDLEGMRWKELRHQDRWFRTFYEQLADCLRKHYYDRSAHVYLLNPPNWVMWLWNIAKLGINKSTLERITIVRGDKKIYDALAARISHENIPEEYGGGSVGRAPEEDVLFQLQDFNNKVAGVDYPLVGAFAKRPFLGTGLQS
ncbi:Aste57867_23503 [Aphanomyces stellatus]|uniref:Aste57867_23503 protein n=1 Tax=Aphanomyces stellatus TaxID=120398 RepID=A0A485LN88_9STRA|nr:hypothetical protein As57867_023432 [Aphanomyces stellatus]VFU00148.1 Aste57867_23503 [Aphanomyces stellatus]